MYSMCHCVIVRSQFKLPRRKLNQPLIVYAQKHMNISPFLIVNFCINLASMYR